MQTLFCLLFFLLPCLFGITAWRITRNIFITTSLREIPSLMSASLFKHQGAASFHGMGGNVHLFEQFFGLWNWHAKSECISPQRIQTQSFWKVFWHPTLRLKTTVEFGSLRVCVFIFNFHTRNHLKVWRSIHSVSWNWYPGWCSARLASCSRFKYMAGCLQAWEKFAADSSIFCCW